MMKAAVLFVASLILASCATRSASLRPVEPAASPACDPRLTVAIEAEPLMVGSLILPVTAEESAAVREHLTGDAEARGWGRRGWERAALARDQCARNRPPPKPSGEG